MSLVDTTGNVLRDVPLPRPRSIQHQLTAARPKMPYAAVMNRKGINREAAAHFLERLDWMVSQLHLHHAPEHNDGCMSLVQRDPSVSFDGVFVHRAMLTPQWMFANLAVLRDAVEQDLEDWCYERDNAQSEQRVLERPFGFPLSIRGTM